MSLFQFSRIAMAAAVIAATPFSLSNAEEIAVMPAGDPTLLTKPYLQNPTSDSVNVAWVTNFPGRRHWIKVFLRGQLHEWMELGSNPETKPEGVEKNAETQKLERLFDDANSRLDMELVEVQQRQAYRHEAVVDGLAQGAHYRYRIFSQTESGEVIFSELYNLQPLPKDGEPVKILLTSDHQERFNSLANYQKVHELFPNLDAIFFAGDLVNRPRRAAEWFDNYNAGWHENPWSTNPGFFPVLQASFAEQVPETPYTGGPLMQNAPLFATIGNHEVSGVFRPNETFVVNGVERTATLNYMFADPQPRWFAEYRYEQQADTVNPTGDPDIKEQWVLDNSNDFETYRDLLTLPDDGPEGESYYAKKIGDVFLISMNVSRIWRSWNIGENDRSKFVEYVADSNNPENWGFGEFIFTPFGEGSTQYQWLKEVMETEEFKSSRYRVVMAHQNTHGLGDNVTPVLSDPEMEIDYLDENGNSKTKQVYMPQDDELRVQVFKTQIEPILGDITHIRYDYPLAGDYFRRDIEPLLHKNGVQLVVQGHSHVWNRFKEGDLNFIETSNVGNCYGAFWAQEDGSPYNDTARGYGTLSDEIAMGAELSRWNPENYPRTGDAHGLQPIYPTLSNPMVDFEGATRELPFVCSGDVTIFSILDTKMGAVRSFAFDVQDTEGKTVEFDRMMLKPAK